jgi:hypothetical protein
MVFLLSLLSFVTVAAGMFALGLGVPIRETWFGAALLMAGSVAITGGFILVALAAAVRELRRVAHGFKAPQSGMPRPVRPLERREERFEGDDRWTESRPHMPVVFGTGAPDVMPRRYDAADARERWHNPRSEEWLRHAQDEIESALRQADVVPPPIDYQAGDIPRPSNSRPRPAIPLPGPPPYPSPLGGEGRVGGRPPAASPASPQDIFDAIWSSQRRNIVEGPEPRIEAPPETRSPSPDSKSPPLAPGQPAAFASTRPAPVEPGPLPILRAGVIQQMAYTLFADGSIEAQLPEGVVRFASIEELLGHLERGEG